MGRFLHSVIAVPITSTVREVSTEVAVGPEDGVRLPSVANLDGVQLVEKALLVRRVGRIRSSTMDAICAALVAAVGCERA
jgi:mRNA interferase MazF